MSDKIIYTTEEAEAGQVANVQMTEQKNTKEKVIPVKKTAVIPVVFIPGILGTNICDNSGKVVWGPPAMAFDHWWEWITKSGDLVGGLIPYIFKTAAIRQQELDPESTKVYKDGYILKGDLNIPKHVLKKRGWGEIWSGAYHPFLTNLTKILNNIVVDNSKNTNDSNRYGEHWRNLLHKESKPEYFGGVYGEASEQLTPDELEHAAGYRFDIWVIGYNWLQSNAQSGKEALPRIKNEILAEYNAEGCEKLAEKVIIVSHSMGGFVTRAMALETESKEVILGVSHGVMPATGAPTTYHHIRCGYGSPWNPANLLLGHNSERVTAVLANAPGGLELLPTMDFNNGDPWLKLHNHDTKQVIELPENKGDVYEDIYKSEEWYGIVPETNTDFIDPKKSVTEEEQSNGISPRSKFDKRVNKVKEFHSDFKQQYFSPTIVIAESTKQQETWNYIYWNMCISNLGLSSEAIKGLVIEHETGTKGESQIVFANNMGKASFQQAKRSVHAALISRPHKN
jgi:hypothetical protein